MKKPIGALVARIRSGGRGRTAPWVAAAACIGVCAVVAVQRNREWKELSHYNKVVSGLEANSLELCEG